MKESLTRGEIKTHDHFTTCKRLFHKLLHLKISPVDHTYGFKLLSEKRIKLDESDESKSPPGAKAPRKQLATKRVLHSFHEKARHVKVSPMKESQSQVSGLGSPNYSIR